MRILMVLTSHDQLGDTGEKTGVWLEEFASPYYYLLEHGADITLASPKGGQIPLDPKSSAVDAQTDATRRFQDDPDAQQALASTKVLNTLKAHEFDAVFYPGGHGPLWDLSRDSDSIALIESFIQQQKPVAAVCHAPAVLVEVKDASGQPLVKGKRVTGFSNSEEAAVNLTDVVPFLLEDALVELGGQYERAADWQAYVVQDGLLITGQNPASSDGVAKALLQALV